MHEKLRRLAERLPGLAIDASDAACSPFTRDASGLEGERPLAVVRPKDAADVKPLVEAARAIGVGLVPVSSGGEHHRGDTLCAAQTVVVDLRGLSRIVRVDRRNRVFIAEPGVTFADLVPALAANGLRPMLPLGPRPEKSVLGAYLEREPTIQLDAMALGNIAPFLGERGGGFILGRQAVQKLLGQLRALVRGERDCELEDVGETI